MARLSIRRQKNNQYMVTIITALYNASGSDYTYFKS